MNSTTAKNGTTEQPTPVADPNSQPAREKDDGFVDIQTQRYMYNVEQCSAKPLIGFLLAVVPMPPIRDRVWHAFLVRTTKPTLGIDRDDKVVEVAEGQDVLIPATHELAQFFRRPCLHPTGVFEVKIVPDHKIDLSGGRQMWLYKLAAKPQPVSRKQFGVIALVDMSPRQLTAGESSESADWMNSDIPF